MNDSRDPAPPPLIETVGLPLSPKLAQTEIQRVLDAVRAITLR